MLFVFREQSGDGTSMEINEKSSERGEREKEKGKGKPKEGMGN